jgi:hypothetical protein
MIERVSNAFTGSGNFLLGGYRKNGDSLFRRAPQAAPPFRGSTEVSNHGGQEFFDGLRREGLPRTHDNASGLLPGRFTRCVAAAAFVLSLLPPAENPHLTANFPVFSTEFLTPEA